jgi:protein-histidine pros-kinase
LYAREELAASLPGRRRRGAPTKVVGQVARNGERRRGPRILLVEDQGDVRNVIIRALESEYQIEIAVDGAEGVERAKALKPDLILTDLKMPRLPGDELVRQVRRIPELDATSILVLSAYGDTVTRIRVLSEGAQDYIAKPFAVGELQARVRNLIAAQRSRALLLDQGAAREAAIFEVALDGIVSMDHRGVVTGFNPAAEAIFGYSRSEALGQPLADLIVPPSLRERHRRGLTRYVASGEGAVIGKRVEMVGMRKDGTEFPVEVSICRIPGSDPPTFTGFLRDLAETKQKADALRAAEAQLAATEAKWKAEQRFRKLLESAPDAMIIVNARGAIVEANAQTETLFGHTRDELIGRDIEVLVPSAAGDEHQADRARYLREPTLRPMGAGLELTGVRKDGREIPLEVSLSPIEMDDGIVIAEAIRDVSERRRSQKIERDLAQEQAARIAAEDAVRTRDDFVAVAGHELRTPLAAMLLQIQVLRRTVQGGPPADLAARVDKIARSGARLERLVEQVLDVSRITAGRLHLERAPCDLAEIARGVADRFADAGAQAHCEVSVRADGHVEGVWDRFRIEAVIGNLLSNALKFGPGRPIEILVTHDDGQAVVRVSDHGIGIDRAELPNLFRRFERALAARDYGGLGLGLWICRTVVEASGGTIEVESELQHGSTFTVRLPLGEKEGAGATSQTRPDHRR